MNDDKKGCADGDLRWDGFLTFGSGLSGRGCPNADLGNSSFKIGFRYCLCIYVDKFYEVFYRKIEAHKTLRFSLSFRRKTKDNAK